MGALCTNQMAGDTTVAALTAQCSLNTMDSCSAAVSTVASCVNGNPSGSGCCGAVDTAVNTCGFDNFVAQFLQRSGLELAANAASDLTTVLLTCQRTCGLVSLGPLLLALMSPRVRARVCVAAGANTDASGCAAALAAAQSCVYPGTENCCSTLSGVLPACLGQQPLQAFATDYLDSVSQLSCQRAWPVSPHLVVVWCRCVRACE